MQFRFPIALISLTMAMACKPEVEISLRQSDIFNALQSGKPVFVEFEAQIENEFTEIDDEKKSEVARIAQILLDSFPGSEVETEFGSSEFEIDVEGEIAVSTDGTGIQTPWFVKVSKTKELGVRIQLEQTQSWDRFASSLQEVNFFAKPGEYLPLAFKLRDLEGQLIVGGAFLNGEPTGGYSKLGLNGDKVTLSFESSAAGDYWDNSAASFLFLPQ